MFRDEYIRSLLLTGIFIGLSTIDIIQNGFQVCGLYIFTIIMIVITILFYQKSKQKRAS